jgi:hypothetical protein
LLVISSTTITTITTQTTVHTFLPVLTELIFEFLLYLDDVKVIDISSMHNWDKKSEKCEKVEECKRKWKESM